MGRTPFQESFRGSSSEDERQRAIIARAIAQTPEILLMDEPAMHLDADMQLEVLDLATEPSAGRKLTVVIASHDLPMAARYCGRMALIPTAAYSQWGSPSRC